MLFENLPLSLPFYPGLKFQDRFRQNVAKAPHIHQLAPYDGLLPFQIRKPILSELPIALYIRCAGDYSLDEYLDGATDTIVGNLSPFISTMFDATTLDGMDVITFKEATNSLGMVGSAVAGGLLHGVYYLHAVFSDATEWVSELFRVPEDRFPWNDPTLCNYPSLKWWHGSDIAPIHYPGDTSFFSRVYLDTFITASEPTYEAVVEKDGNGEVFPTFQKMVIKYRLSQIVPDFLKVAFYVMQMHDNVILTTEKGIRSGEIKNLDISSTLTNDGSFSQVEILFEQTTLLINTSCEDNMEAPVCAAPVDYVVGVTTAEWRLPDQSLYLKLSSAPTGYSFTLEALHGASTWDVILGYISRADLLAGYTKNMGTTYPYYTKVRLRRRSFTCPDLGASQQITPTLTY